MRGADGAAEVPPALALDGVALASRRSLAKRSADREPELACSICAHDGFDNAWSIGVCGHTFCEDCIFHWLTNKATCPDCRTVVSVMELVPNHHAPKRARPAEPEVVLSMPTEIVM